MRHVSRRDVLEVLTALVSVRSVPAFASPMGIRPMGIRMSETYAQVAKPEDIARQWPDGRDAPQLILHVATYLKDKPWGSLGYTRLLGDRMDDYWIENGADLWRDFGCFMRLPDGSRVAQWFRDGASGEPPVVLIGSEGEQQILAPDLPAFLAAWALAGFDDQGALVAATKSGSVAVKLPSDLVLGDNRDADAVPDGRPAFAAFLERQLGAPLAQVLKPAPADAPFAAFFTAWGEEARAEMASNENLKAIAAVMDHHIPRGKKIWERESFNIAAIDNRIEIAGKGDPRQPLAAAEADAIRPHIAAERERRAKGVHAPRGLWNSAQLQLYPDGACHIAADWSPAPKFWHGPAATAAELASEHKRFPKSDRWIESWMRELK